MPRLARVVVPGLPHHVTQRGNRRLPTFFGEADYARYRELLAERCGKAGVAVWAYCLMPNHVHLIVVPPEAAALRAAFGETHRRYAAAINLRQAWQGHLWQERFHSFPVDEAHLAAAVRYVELNPVRARLVRRAARWPWSSAAAHLAGRDDALVSVAPLLERLGDWAALLGEGGAAEEIDVVRRHVRSGRPLGSAAFVAALEQRLGRILSAKPRGRPPKIGEKG